MQEDDPRRDLLATVIRQWRQHLTAGREYTVQQLINHAINVNDFHVALLNVAGGGNTSRSGRQGPSDVEEIRGLVRGGALQQARGSS